MKTKEKRFRKEEIQNLPLYRLFPSIITISSMCFGLTSIRFAFDANWEVALTLLVLAAFLDGMDGRIARFLNLTSEFGAQLDSLVDFVNFGIVPALSLYLWTLSSVEIKGLSWFFVLVYATCIAIRLARFNSMLLDANAEQNSKWQDKFFLGVPAPAGAMLAMLPIALTLEFGEISFIKNPYLIGVYLCLVAFAMQSKIPTFSVKKFYIPRDKISLALAIFSMFIAIFVLKPWLMFSFVCVLYIISIPISAYKFSKNFKIYT